MSEWIIDIDEPVTNSLRFNLVCDPKYSPSRIVANKKDWFEPIRINSPEDILTSCHHTCDMGFSAFAQSLPIGEVQFVLESPVLSRLMQCRETAEDKVRRAIPVMLSCFRINEAGSRVRDRRDKRWILEIRTDLATKLPVVCSTRSVPIWCSRCREAISGRARVCETCEDYGVCWLCYPRRNHQADHAFANAEISL